MSDTVAVLPSAPVTVRVSGSPLAGRAGNSSVKRPCGSACAVAVRSPRVPETRSPAAAVPSTRIGASRWMTTWSLHTGASCGAASAGGTRRNQHDSHERIADHATFPILRGLSSGPLSPSGVHPVVVRGAEARVVRSEEQRHRGDVERLDAPVEALRRRRSRPRLRDCTICCWRGVWTLPGTIVLTRMPSRPTSRARLRVSPSIAALATWYTARSAIPRCQLIEPRLTIEPPPAGAHRRNHRLGGEELVLEVDRHALVPIGRRDVLELVAIIVGGVVDQHVATAERRSSCRSWPRTRRIA